MIVRGLTSVITYIACAKVAGLVHVQPQSIKREVLVERLQLAAPPALRGLIPEVWIVHSSSPELQGPQSGASMLSAVKM